MEPLISWTAVSKRYANNEKFIRQIAVILREQCPKFLEDIESAVLSKDSKTLHRTSHTLKDHFYLFKPRKPSMWLNRLSLWQSKMQWTTQPP